MSTLTNIQILRSAVPHKRPDPNFLLDGQLALNYKQDDPGLFAKLQDGGMFKIGPAAYTTTGVAPNQNPGVGGVAGNLVGEEWNDGRAAFYSPIKKFYNGADWETLGGFAVDDATGNLTCLKLITVSAIETDVIHVDGPAIINGDITPDGTTCIHDIGKLNERWRGIYCCELDLSGSLAIGGDLTVNGGAAIGLDLSVGGDITVNGEATFGTNCSNDKFTVKAPTYLNCDTEILGNLTVNSDVEILGDLKLEGNFDIGTGCSTGNEVNFYSNVKFHCAVDFLTYPIEFESITITDLLQSLGDTIIGSGCDVSNLTVNATSEFNCLTTFFEEVRVGRGAVRPQFTTFGPNYFYQTIESGDGLILAGKGSSALTVDSDPDNTMVTKKWAEDAIISGAADATPWEVSGATIKTKTTDLRVIPNGTNATVGTDTTRWKAVYANDVYTNDLHLKNERGDWTMIEEEHVLTLRNNKTGKRYAISMTPYEG